MPRLLCALLLAATMVGCRADVRAEVIVPEDGMSTVAWVAHFDAAAVEWLADAGIDPAEVVRGAVGEPWTLDHTSDDEGVEVRVSREVADAEAIGDVLRELTEGLVDEDPALLVDVDLDRSRRTVRVDGTAMLRAPASGGVMVDGEPAGLEVHTVRELMERHVHAELAFMLPGTPVAHDGALVDGWVVYELPVDEPRTVSVEARVDRSGSQRWWMPAALVFVAAVAAAVVGLRKRLASRG